MGDMQKMMWASNCEIQALNYIVFLFRNIKFHENPTSIDGDTVGCNFNILDPAEELQLSSLIITQLIIEMLTEGNNRLNNKKKKIKRIFSTSSVNQ